MEKDKPQDTSNPFAQLKLKSFPDQAQKDEKPNNTKLSKNTSYKTNTPQKNTHVSANSQMTSKTESILEDDESSLFFANMASVQKLVHSPKENQKNKSTKIRPRTTRQPENQSSEDNLQASHLISHNISHTISHDNLSNIHLTSTALLNTILLNTAIVTSNDTAPSNDNPQKNTDNTVANNANNNAISQKKLPQNLNFTSEQKIEKALNLKGDVSKTYTPFGVPNAFSKALSSQKNQSQSHAQYNDNVTEKMPAFSPLSATAKSKISLTNQHINTPLSKNTSHTNTPHTDGAHTDNHDDDLNLFFSAVSDVKNLHGKGREVVPKPNPTPISPTPVVNFAQDLIAENLEFALHSTEEYIEAHVVGLDFMTLAKLQSRQYKPEAHIDLHGLNCEQAYANLIAFFKNSYHRGLRSVLVVTGKGNKSINGTAVLRNKTQEWFTQDPFKRVVLAFCSAKVEDGGSGALYVLIRKQKKNYGAIPWDMRPTDPDFFF